MAAHMDEVGLMVRFITAEGYIKFQTLGGWLDQALINQRWVIQTRNGPRRRSIRHQDGTRYDAGGADPDIQA